LVSVVLDACEGVLCCGLPPRLSRHVKTIANTRFATALGANPHVFAYNDSRFAVNERFERCDKAIVGAPSAWGP
jgi:hypothetical protein